MLSADQVRPSVGSEGAIDLIAQFCYWVICTYELDLSLARRVSGFCSVPYSFGYYSIWSVIRHQYYIRNWPYIHQNSWTLSSEFGTPPDTYSVARYAYSSRFSFLCGTIWWGQQILLVPQHSRSFQSFLVYNIYVTVPFRSSWQFITSPTVECILGNNEHCEWKTRNQFMTHLLPSDLLGGNQGQTGKLHFVDCQLSTFHSPDLSYPVNRISYVPQCVWKVANLGRRYKDFRYFSVRFGHFTTVTQIIIYTLGCSNKVLNVSVCTTNDGRSFLFYTSVSIKSFSVKINFSSAHNTTNFLSCFTQANDYPANLAAVLLGFWMNRMFYNLHHSFGCYSH